MKYQAYAVGKTTFVAIPNWFPLRFQEVFVSFARVARWLGSKPPQVPDVVAVHLYAALTALFHRLYALFPCNFLEFLRRHFGPVAMTTMKSDDPNNVFNQKVREEFYFVLGPMKASEVGACGRERGSLPL